MPSTVEIFKFWAKAKPEGSNLKFNGWPHFAPKVNETLGKYIVNTGSKNGYPGFLIGKTFFYHLLVKYYAEFIPTTCGAT